MKTSLESESCLKPSAFTPAGIVCTLVLPSAVKTSPAAVYCQVACSQVKTIIEQLLLYSYMNIKDFFLFVHILFGIQILS